MCQHSPPLDLGGCWALGGRRHQEAAGLLPRRRDLRLPLGLHVDDRLVRERNKCLDTIYFSFSCSLCQVVSHGVFSWGYVALAAVSLVVCLLMVLGLRLQDRAVNKPSRSFTVHEEGPNS